MPAIPGPGSRRRVGAVVVAALAVLALVGRLEGRSLGTRHELPTTTLAPTPVPSALPGTAESPVRGMRLVASIPLASPARQLAAGEGALWVLQASNALLRVDPASNRVSGRVQLAPPDAQDVTGPLVVGQGAVWVGTPAGTVRVDPLTLRVTATVAAAVEQAADGALWARCCPGEDGEWSSVLRVDPGSLRTGERVRPGQPIVTHQPGIAGLAVGSGSIWTIGFAGGGIWRTAQDGARSLLIQVPGAPQRLLARDGVLWVLSNDAEFQTNSSVTLVEAGLARLDGASAKVTAVARLDSLDEGNLSGPAVGDGSVWVLGSDEAARPGSMLVRVDAASGRLSGRFPGASDLGGSPLAAGYGGIWAYRSSTDELVRLAPGR